MNWRNSIFLLNKSPAYRVAVCAAIPGLILYVFHVATHSCMCGHLAHESHRFPVPLDIGWWLFFSASLVATLFIKAPKYGFYLSFVFIILISEAFLITAPLLLFSYYKLGKKEQAPNQALEPTTLAVTFRAPSRTDRAS